VPRASVKKKNQYSDKRGDLAGTAVGQGPSGYRSGAESKLIESLTCRAHNYTVVNKYKKGWNMRTVLLASVVCLLITAASGCAVIGRNSDYHSFDPKLLSSVEPGKTRAADITKAFGAPNEVIKLSNGNAYMYTRSTSKGTGLWLVLVTFANYDKKHDQVVFFFDKNDTLTHYGSSIHAAEAEYGMPF